MTDRVYTAECGCKGTATRWTQPCPKHKAEDDAIRAQAKADHEAEMKEKGIG